MRHFAIASVAMTLAAAAAAVAALGAVATQPKGAGASDTVTGCAGTCVV